MGEQYLMGSLPRESTIETRQVELIVGEDCNLRCTYCYLTGKNNKRKMSFDVARQAVDFALKDSFVSNASAVNWVLSGGEALMQIDLIDEISDYIKYAMYKQNHHWFNNYIFNIGSNGLLYDHPKVQKYLHKNRNHVYMAVTIDGNKEKHDISRVFPDGRGSYDKVVKNAKLWLEQFNQEKVTKSTFSHADLPYLKDSILNLWNLGINYVMANVVFEEVWQEGDDLILEQQLKELADHILANELWKKYTVRFFDPALGFPYIQKDRQASFCGSGKHMIAIDCEGKIYPCIRFVDMSLTNQLAFAIGDIYQGINHDRLRALLSFSVKTVSKPHCLNCEVASGCAFCAGFNYDSADTSTVFQRATYLCKMHKANVRACDYFWDKFKQVTGLPSKRDVLRKERAYELLKNNEEETSYLLFLIHDNILPHCNYTAKDKTTESMSQSLYEQGRQFCEKSGFVPVLMGDADYVKGDDDVFKLVPAQAENLTSQSLMIFDEEVTRIPQKSETCILLISKKTISKLPALVATLQSSFERINIIIKDLEHWQERDAGDYEKVLIQLVDYVIHQAQLGRFLTLSNLTDLLKLKKMNNCDAGETSFTLAPNGKIYICPAFYFQDPEDYIGTLEDGITIKNKQLLELQYAPICSVCDAHHCKRCKYLNKKLTGELNTPSHIQCLASHVERNATRALQLKLIELKLISFVDVLPEIDYLDPLDILIQKNHIIKVGAMN
jgi:radical SAM peptide maturase (CXXX-repeat target family)/CXXX repeat peptide maturase